MCICPNCGTGIDVEYKRVEEIHIRVDGMPACGAIGDLEEMINEAAKDGWRPFMPLSEHIMLMTRVYTGE